MSERPSPTPIARLKSLFVDEVTRSLDPRSVFWFGLSVMFAVAFGGLALRQAFSGPYVLQDDWRHHVFWMARLVDSSLFPHDLIADYFQSVAPLGYATLYRIAAGLGVHPFLFARLIPIALGLIATVFCFGVSMNLLRVPFAGFVGSLLLNESLWMRNGLVSATPRAFIAPLLLAFMYFYLRNSIIFTLLTIALMGLFFPSTMFIALGVVCLGIFRLERWRIRFSRDRRDYLVCAASLAVAAMVLLPYALRSSGFGPVVTANEGRLMPEFLPGGRMVVFRQNFWGYWITGSHTGAFTSAVFAPFAICLGLLLPLAFLFPKQVPLIARVSSVGAALLSRILIASVAIFFAANILLFRLYLPSRFTTNSFRIVLALAAGISAVLILDAVFRSAGPIPGLSAAALLAIAIFLPFATGTVIDTRYKTGGEKALYEFLKSQPKDILIASLSDESNNIPIFAERSVLVSRETALPFHKGYYSQIRERVVDLIKAQYTPDLSELQSFLRKYGVTYLLIDREAFEPEYVHGDKWAMQYQPAARDAAASLKRGVQPALVGLLESCSVYQNDRLRLISAQCVLNTQPGSAALPQ